MESGPMTPLCLALYPPFGLAQYHRNRHITLNTMGKQTRKSYDKAFKLMAVELY